MHNLDIYKFFRDSPFNSVKVSSYFEVYEDLFSKFRGREITFVEIGVLDGGSLFMWRNYFGPDARIIGVDFNPQAKRLTQDGFEIFVGDQADPEFWRDFYNNVGLIDILLDDGGHTYEQQIVTTLESIPFISNNGMLVVEDTCTSYMSEFGFPTKYSFIEWAKKHIDSINSRFECSDIEQLNNFGRRVKAICFFESIVALKMGSGTLESSTNIENGKTRFGAVDYRYYKQDKLHSGSIKQINSNRIIQRILRKLNRTYRQISKKIQRRRSLYALKRFF